MLVGLLISAGSAGRLLISAGSAGRLLSVLVVLVSAGRLHQCW